MTEKQRRHLVNCLERDGYIIWAELVASYKDEALAHHMWNTLPEKYRPSDWRQIGDVA